MTVYDELVARGLIAQVTDEEEIKESVKYQQRGTDGALCPGRQFEKYRGKRTWTFHCAEPDGADERKLCDSDRW